MPKKKNLIQRSWKFFQKLGPGLITGAADDDPSGIATYSQTGAQFGYGQLWTALYMLPFLIAIQEACARIGAVSGKGIAGVIKEHYNKPILYFMVILTIIANTINIGADIGAMAAAANLIYPFNFTILTLLFTALMLIMEIFISYRHYASYLKWLSLFLGFYLLTAIIANGPWLQILKATFVPHLEFNFQFLFIITAVLGTTISPYMFFWQASQVVEEEKALGLLKKNTKIHIPKKWITHLRLDNFIGMVASQVATWCIIVVGAAVLHTHGMTDIKTSADAAMALAPLVKSFPYSGYLAELIFSVGIIGLGLLAVPVLATSGAYALSEALNWEAGLNLKFSKAHGFYGVITVAMLIGLCINFIGIDPIKALVYSAVINGILSIPLIFLIGLMASNKKIMGEYKSGWWSTIFVWLTFAGVLLAAIGMIISLGKS